MSHPPRMLIRLGLLLAAVLFLLSAASVSAQICHDNLWPDGEFCGHDAYVVTGQTDMNHDCVVDFLDVALFQQQFFAGLTGPNLSADINGDQVINLSDIQFLAASLGSGQAVTPCNPSPAAFDTCSANLSLSFATGHIVSRVKGVTPGLVTVYVIAAGWQDAAALEFGIEHTGNMILTNSTGQANWNSIMGFDSGNRRYQTWANNGVSAAGTTVVVALDFLVLDAAPATVRLIDYGTAPDYLNRWSPSTLDRLTEFQVRRHVGINTLDPVSVTACPSANTSPTVAITNPATDIVVPFGNTPYAVAGTAADSDGTLDFVEYRVNAGIWQQATGTANWTASIPLIVGENWIQVRAADTRGAYSSTQVVTITRLPAPDLAITAWTAPSSLNIGCSQVFVTATCANLSAVAGAGPSRLGFYLSSDAVINASDFLVGTVDLLAIGASRDTTVSPRLMIGDGGPRGAVYLGVLADDQNAVTETNENNNGSASAFDFPVPVLNSVSDVGNDQGRFVMLNLLASARDAAGSATPILQYEVFRRVDPLPAKPATSSFGGRQISDPAKLAGWVYAGSVPAHGEAEYNVIAPTLADSTDQGVYFSVFFVRAATAQPLVFFDSCPDSGYSVDNLPPSVPKAMTVAYAAPGNQLTWDPNPEADFRYFRIYRGSEVEFVPSPENLVAATTGTEWLDTAANPWHHYYQISAVDQAGNESPATAPDAVSGTPDLPPLPTRYALHPAVPNPFNPSTRISFDLAGRAQVKLDVYATDGRLVATLVDQTLPAGPHEVVWGGRDRSGRQVATGVYFYRLDAAQFSQTRRMVLLK